MYRRLQAWGVQVCFSCKHLCKACLQFLISHSKALVVGTCNCQARIS